jgi:choline dehydrogenase-like flavoprotein
MELDASQWPDGASLEADLCIIGAGPAGIVLAREFLGTGIKVLLLESGGVGPEEWPQTLNEGTVVGHSYAGLRPTRNRQVGGVSPIWNTPVAGLKGAKYVPLDPWDLDRPPKLASGWPIGKPELDPFYRRAQEACGIGPYLYDGADWADSARPPLPLPERELVTRVYQFGGRLPFTTTYPELFASSPNVRIHHHATVCRLKAGPGDRVEEAEIASPDGRRHRVRAATFVLAAGAIENPRLLQVSGLGNTMVGRCFMEHPRDNALTLIPASPEVFSQAAFYDAHFASDGTIVGGRIALSEHAVRGLGFPNASLTLLPRVREEAPPRGILARLHRAIRDLTSPRPRGGYGWSKHREPFRYFDALKILVNLEQRPDPENRVVLGTDLDALGIPRPVLHWRWRSDEQEEIVRLRGFLAAALESAGLGKVIVDESQGVDPNAHHHAGTTRMSSSPRDGVVDPGGRVHGVTNLYVAGASVFPTSGFANPTLTLVALAIRLADRLKGEGFPPVERRV